MLNLTAICRLAEKNKFNQDIFVLEEMAELQKELMKHRRGRANKEEIGEEISDVILTCLILAKVYNLTDDDLINKMNYKLSRLREEL